MMRAVSRFCTQLTVAAAAADDVTAVSGGITFLVIGFILGRPVDALCGSFKEDLSVSTVNSMSTASSVPLPLAYSVFLC